MKTYFLVFLLVCFSGCNIIERSFNDKVLTIIFKYSKKLKKEGMFCTWYGLDHAGEDKVYDGKIHKISLGYGVDRNLKCQEARKLFYRVVDDFLQEINSHEELKEGFFHFPVTYEDLHFSLCFDYKHKGLLNKDDVDQISIEFNKIFYFIVKNDNFQNQMVGKELVPGMGKLSFTGEDSLRTIVRKLPERESELGL